MRRATSTRVALHPCKRQSTPHIPWHNPPPPRRTLYLSAGERLPGASYGIPSQSQQRIETTRGGLEDISMQKRILNVRPWKFGYNLLHTMVFVRELERRFGRVLHIYLIKDPVSPRDYQQQFTVVFENVIPAKEINGLRKGKNSTPVLTAKWSLELEKEAFRCGGPSLASLREYLAHAPKCEGNLSNHYGVMETDAIEATLHVPSTFFFLQGKKTIPLIPRPIRNRFIQSLLDFGGFASNPTQQMRGVLEYHKKNLQQHAHVNDAWEEAFRSDSELRGTRQALSRIVHRLPKAAQLHESIKDNTTSAASQDDYLDKPVHHLLDATELRDLCLGTSEVEEDVSLLEGLTSHIDKVHIDDPSRVAEDGIPRDIPAAEACGVLGEEGEHVSGHYEESAPHSAAPVPEQRRQFKVQSVGAGADGGPQPSIPSRPFDMKSDARRRQLLQVPLDSAPEGAPFRRLKIPSPLTEDDVFKLGGTWSEGTHDARAVDGGRLKDHFSAPRQRVYQEEPWPEPLPVSAFAERPREVSVERLKTPKKQESDKERAVIRTLRKRLSSFLKA